MFKVSRKSEWWPNLPSQERRLGKERLLRIIAMCLQVKQKGIDPFEVEVKKSLEIIRRYLPEWKIPEDLILDAEALNQISEIIALQSEWLRNHASSIYVDPLMIELKVRALDARSLSGIFIKSWHPVVEMERLTPKMIEKSIEYWKALPPIEKRLKNLPVPPFSKPELISMGALLRLGLLSEKKFSDVLQFFWQELKRQSKGAGKKRYWDFILADTYEETVLRGYITSFLVSYGYATLEVDPLKEDIFLIPLEEVKKVEKREGFSVPISIDYETWKKMRGGRN